MSFDHIPEELRLLPRWCCFDITEDGKKVPYIAGNCAKAASNKPTTWRTFEEATKDVVDGKRQHLGLAISYPYFFVDLDEAQPQIFEALETYAQRSVSGRGTHLIGKGQFEGPGKHPNVPKVGMFKENRFVLFTGDVVEGRNEIKEVDEETLQGIYNWLGGAQTSSTISLVETPPSVEDEEVYARCAARFDTFEHLWNGNAGEDHSESDHALISMLADCCDSNEQVRRMWFGCPLCRENRRNDKYVDYSIKKARAKQKEFEGYTAEWANEEEKQTVKKFQDIGSRDMIDSLPEGLIKRIADWHWTQSLYPLQECSIAVAFTVIATVAGRNFQTITRSGLNPWIILLAETSWGKNEYKEGITSIFGKVDSAGFIKTNYSKMAAGSAASGEGLEDHLLKNPRVSCYFPEFDTVFKNLTTSGGPAHIQSMTRFILDLYGRSGKNSYLTKRIKARGKDEEESAPIQAPCLVVGGETIPKKLYEHMTTANVDSGFLQRFSLFESSPQSVSSKMNPKQGEEMPSELLDEITDFFAYCETLSVTNEFITVEVDDKAKKKLTQYVNDKRDESLDSDSEGIKQALNRAGLKAFKFTGLFAVAANWNNPIVTTEHVDWVVNFVNQCDARLVERFESGSIGSGQTQQEQEIREFLAIVVKWGKEARKKAGIPEELARFREIVPHAWLKKKIVQSNAFSSDRNGAVNAFERCLNHMAAAGEIVKIPLGVAEEKYGEKCGPVVGFR